MMQAWFNRPTSDELKHVLTHIVGPLGVAVVYNQKTNRLSLYVNGRAIVRCEQIGTPIQVIEKDD